MSYRILRELFSECLARSYTNVENAASFDVERDGGTLFLFLEQSRGAEDWQNNLNFRVRPYDDMHPAWYCHAGFLRVFKSLLPHVVPYIESPNTRRIVTVGYSHGGALAILCHEAAWYRRPDIRTHVRSFAFGAPRVLFGPVPIAVRKRFGELYLIHNQNDIVTRVPPAMLGYRHIGNIITIGEKGALSPVDAHRPESYLAALEALE